jgi:hypothetical protein
MLFCCRRVSNVHVFITGRTGKTDRMQGFISRKDSYMDDNMDKENIPAMNGATSTIRRLGFVAAGIGLGSVFTYLLFKALGGRTDKSSRRHLPDHIVDDRGTGQEKAAHILRNLRDRAFEASDEKLALALGRPVEEVAAWNAGRELIDDDVVMKARGIAMNRGIHIE